jgi:hypothetical protein
LSDLLKSDDPRFYGEPGQAPSRRSGWRRREYAWRRTAKPGGGRKAVGGPLYDKDMKRGVRGIR